MVNEFDKEIDAMLRDLAKGDSFAQVLPETHLDADEISAFAENVLPNKARLRITGHLADCSKCRRILANLAFLTSEAESEIIHEESKTIVSLPVIPWYKKLFAASNLTYAMGALALLLVGMIGLFILQNSNRSEPMVAQADKAASAEKSSGPNAGTLEGDAGESPTYAANSNSSSTANVPMATPAAVPAANSANTSNGPVSKDAGTTAPVISTEATPSDLKASKAGEDKVTENESVNRKDDAPTDLAKKEEPKPEATTTDDSVTGGRRDTNKQNEISQTRNIQNITPDGVNVQRNQTVSPPPAASGAGQEQPSPRAEPKKKAAEKRSDEDEKTASTETRSIGSKSFRKVGGVWTDTSYTGGSTKNVKRGSDDYKKLDSGLQNIGNSLSGTVIVVWGGKNYKIQ
ncbi:MAG: hypothetical protein K1X72_27685 [Pyrinomonadaceae bacterium]|nr:hypothetical protein [Pyrinomonadaceae bacterium]